jgi:hypothetical protein
MGANMAWIVAWIVARLLEAGVDDVLEAVVEVAGLPVGLACSRERPVLADRAAC